MNIVYRIAFDFDNMEAMMGFFDIFKQTNNPNYIKAELVHSEDTHDEDKIIHQFIVRNELIGKGKDVNIIPIQKGKNKNEREN
jgi:hypothetical protein